MDEKKMKFSDLELPSNKKFGYFFSTAFMAFSLYFFWENSIFVSSLLFALSLLFLIITLVKADALLQLNKLWARFGLLLGIVVSPIVLGIIFFGLFSPISMVMWMKGRDELRLKFKEKPSHWIIRSTSSNQKFNFKNQF